VPNSTARRNARDSKPRRAHTMDRAQTPAPKHNRKHAGAHHGDRTEHRADGPYRRRDDNGGDDRRAYGNGTGGRRSGTAARQPDGDRGASRQGGRTPNHEFRGDRRGSGGRQAHAFDRTTRRRSAKPARWSEQPATRRADTASPRKDTESSGRLNIATTRPSATTFAELGLPTPLLDALREAGIAEPFPIQAATLPDALAGRDVLGRAQTGSGKTLAFGLALLTALHGDSGRSRPRYPRALILVPTRELAMQVADVLLPLAKSLGLWCRTVVGGMSFTRQADQLRLGIDLLIATPGRLSDHVRQGTCVLDEVRFVAVDEADQMADMGFLPQVRAILDLVPDGQRMLFSATLDGDVGTLVDEYLTDPATHSTDPPTAAVSTMEHHLLLVSQADKAAVVAELAARDGRTILFLRTKHHVDRLTRQLRAVGVRAGALHGGKAQNARNRVLGDFRDGRLPVLVATDVAARGIHVDDVSLVVHVDPPADAKGYLHRAGRTARAGATGTVVTLVTHQERRTVFRMTEQAGVRPERTTVRPGDHDLVRITGARTPPGEPVPDEPVRQPAHQPTRRPGGRFNRPPVRRRAPRRAR
jgi:superfamily II DNA/RNA helicase